VSERLRLVVASLNPAKGREIAEILAAEGLEAEVLTNRFRRSRCPRKPALPLPRTRG